MVPLEPVDPDRVATLARRVGWLDRYRRPLAVVVAFVLTLFAMDHYADLFETELLHVYVVLLGIFTIVVSWWTFEVALAWITALWETEHDRSVRTRWLPRAIWRRRPRRP